MARRPPINSPERELLNRAVDLDLLKKQAETVGVLLSREGKAALPKDQKEHLEGLWNMLHDIMDDLEFGKECTLGVYHGT